MVLVHKLKQMEQIDVEQFRTEDDRETDQDKTRNDESKPGSNYRRRSHSPPRRPLTRSQTVGVAKRRRRDESPEAKTPLPSPRKKPKQARKITAGKAETEAKESGPSTTPPLKSDTTGVSATPLLPMSSTQLTFLDPSSSSTIPLDWRGPRARAVLPVPVPNLTKKSRGRRVPTRLVPDKAGEKEKETRMYVCQVDECGKCFHRGEHLKRHIRSIHTHEKPFKCTHAGCEKFFNRHDNLLQHLKVHKDLATPPPSHSPEPDDSRPSQPLPQRHRSPSPVREPPKVESYHPRRIDFPRVVSYHAAYTAPPPVYGSSLETSLFSTNMAVSSLRTQLPNSPPSSRKGLN